jgi:hypothetical protein
MTCTECKDTGRYVGLNSIEICRACGGVEVTVRLTRVGLVNLLISLSWHSLDASEDWQPGDRVYVEASYHNARLVRNETTHGCVGEFVRWATPEELGARP